MSPSSIFFQLTFTVVIVTGVLGNSLVCVVVLLYKQMRTTMNYLLFNLAISNAMLLVFFGPAILIKLGSNTTVQETGCVVFSGEDIGWICKYLSSYLLILITLEHCLAVKTPLKIKNNIVVRRQRSIIVVCWVVPVISQVITVFFKYYYSCSSLNNQLTFKFEIQLYYHICSVFHGVLPMLVITTLCLISIHSLYFKRNWTPKFKKNQLIVRLRMRNAIKVVIFLGTSYIAAGIPEIALYLFLADQTSKTSTAIAFFVFVSMTMVSSALTPLVSSFFLKRFRYFTKKLFRTIFMG